MAVDGRKLKSSIYQTSDEFREFPCSPCSKEGRTVTASKHCVDCDENLCSSCLKDHNKFYVMRGHQMLDKVQRPKGANLQLPKQRCAKHGGKVIDVYCPGHDTVCCSTCIAVDHSSCVGVSFIPDIANNIRTSHELQQFESKMSSLRARCISLSQSKDSDTQTLKQDKNKILGEIRDFRKKINDHFDEMERKLVDEADVKFKQKLKHVDQDKVEIQDILEDMKKAEQRLKTAKSESEAELFVVLKSERAGLDRKFAVISKMDCGETTSDLKLTKEKKVEDILNGNCGIGEVEEFYKNIVSTLQGEYDIKAKTDKKTCSITGICSCQGYIFLTDYNNKRLKKLDNDYTLTSYLSMPDVLIGVCNVDEKQLAVTLPNSKKVQFVSCTEPMQLQASFHVGDYCRGIEYNNGLLFVCCGGGKVFKEGPGHLEIYKINGTLLKYIYDMEYIPRSLSVSHDGNYVYLTYCCESRLDIFRTYGNSVQQCQYQQCQYQEVKGGSGICRLSSNLLFITGRHSNNIAVVTNDGEMQQLILTRKDNIKSPLAICFNKNKSMLLVSSTDSDKIKVYQLNI